MVNTELISAIICCKNEEQNLHECVAALADFVDEIVIADSGSTDRTLEIARRLPKCRVVEREFVNFSDFRNWSLQHAHHDWVLFVDADERVTAELGAELRDAVQSAPDDCDAFSIRRLWYFLGHPIRYSGYQNDSPVRLFRKDKCRYGVQRVHESVSVLRNRVRKLKNHLLHYSIWSYDEFLEKHIRYTRLGAQDQWERGKRAGFIGLFVRPFARFFQLYVIRRGFLDGLPGLQWCFLTAFFMTYLKQARLWEMAHAIPRPTTDANQEPESPSIAA